MAFVIIPAYKPDRTLISLAEQIWDTGCRIVVVDDGSGEEYQDIFEEISDVAVILRHPENRGKGAAIKSALFEKLGCQKAYNLDGGHCSFMVYRGNTVNHPYKPEKQVSDGVVITEGLS